MTSLNKVIESDVVEFLKAIPDSSANLVIADPPYNLGPTFGNQKEWIQDREWITWCREWLSQCQRILRDDGNLFVYGIHHYLCYVQVELYELGMSYRRQIIWNYENGFSSYKRNLAAHYEPLLWFSKTTNFYFDPIREPYKSTERLKSPVIKNGKVWTPNPAGRLAGDVWKFPTLAGKRFADEKVDHPTQKPLSISKRIVDHFSPAGGVVVIPFAGSGSECLAARMLGRDFMACEINPDYVDLANTRIAQTLDA